MKETIDIDDIKDDLRDYYEQFVEEKGRYPDRGEFQDYIMEKQEQEIQEEMEEMLEHFERLVPDLPTEGLRSLRDVTTVELEKRNE